MYCGKCGAPIIQNARFCGKCGAPVQQMPAQQAPVQQMPAQQMNVMPQAPAAQHVAAAPQQNVYQNVAQLPVSQQAWQQPQAPVQPTAAPAGIKGALSKNPFKKKASGPKAASRPQTQAVRGAKAARGGKGGLNVGLLAGIAIAVILVIALVVVVGGSLSGGGSSSRGSCGGSDILTALGTPVLVVLLGLMVVCAFKESSTTGLYKAFGVYGRIRAYLFIDFVFAGIAMIFAVLAMPFGGENLGITNTILYLVGGVVLLVLGAGIYLMTYARCPDMLKGKLLISMLISGWGVAMKVAVFFIGFVWAIAGPQEFVDTSGRTVYVYDGDVYTGDGTKVGVVDPNDRNRYISYE